MPQRPHSPFCHDATERPIERPQDPTEQAACDSGKKKGHTAKNLLLIDQTLLIRFLSDTVDGHVHDKRMADANPYPLPPNSWLLQDLGFLGFTLAGVETLLPFKKPKGGILTQAQDALIRHGVEFDQVDIVWVPGSFELPAVARKVAASRRNLPGMSHSRRYDPL